MFSQELKHALANNEFCLVYQPIIDILERKIIGVEALIRWESRTMGKVQPKEFIELLEDSEMIHEVGYFVLEKALSDYALLLSNEENQLLLSVNISPVQLTHNNFIQNVSLLINKYNIPHEYLIFEVVESQKFDKITMVRENLKWLRTMGINIAIDDFGTEYSSLTRLSDLDVQFIKIDKAFFDNIHKSLSHALLVSGVIALAKRMNIAIISEGIENYNQLLYLIGQECRLVQGYYFEKPMPIELLKTVINKRYEILLSLEDQKKLSNDLETGERTQLDEYKLTGLELGLIEIDSFGIILDINKIMNQWAGGMSDIMIGTHISEWLIIEDKNDLHLTATNNSSEQFLYEDLLEEVISLKLVDGSALKLLMTSQFNSVNKTVARTQLLYFENISQLDSAMKHIVEKRASYKRVFQFSPLPILVWNLNYRIMDWNLEAEKLFNLKLHENLISIGQLFNKEGLELLRNYTDKVMLSKETVMEATVFDGIGNTHLCRWYSQPIYDDHNNITRIISIIDDITDRKNAEYEIKRLYHVLDQSEQMYLLIDGSGDVLYANHQIKDLIQKPFDNINELDIEFVNDDNTLQMKFDDQDDVWTGTCRIYGENIISLSCYREVIMENDFDTPKILLSLRDEAENQEYQREMDELKKKFAEQDRLAAIGHLAAGIAHEINNPLSYMLTNTNYLMKLKNSKNIQGEAFYDEIFDIVESYQEGLSQIKNIVGDLKSFIHSGNSEFQVMQINDIIPKVINVAYNEIKYSAVVKLELFEGLNLVPINKSKLQQVLLNLILNANHAITKKFDKNMGEIKVSTQNTDNGILIKVSDNGCGMDAQTMSRIFESFYTTKAEGVGSGLGLSISKEIIENLHNGELTVSSEEQKGTDFTIYLPNESIN